MSEQPEILDCKCPEGYPVQVIYEARWHPAVSLGLPAPKAVVLGHTGECPLHDEVLRVLADD